MVRRLRTNSSHLKYPSLAAKKFPSTIQAKAKGSVLSLAAFIQIEILGVLKETEDTDQSLDRAFRGKRSFLLELHPSNSTIELRLLPVP